MDILLFGITREIAGTNRLTIPAGAEPNTVSDLRKWLIEAYPGMSKLSSLAIAVNNEYAGDGESINSSAEIALIPPVSGG